MRLRAEDTLGAIRGVIRKGTNLAGSPRERRQIRAANTMGLGLFAVSWPYVLVFATVGQWKAAMVISILCASYLGAPVLNAKGHHLAAKVTPLIFAALGVYLLSSALGRQVHMHDALFMITVWAFNLFDVRRNPKLLVLLASGPGVLYILIELGVLLPIPTFTLTGATAAVVPPATMGFAYALLVWVLFLFYRVNQANEDKLSSTVTALRNEVFERKRNQARADVARAEAERASRAKSEFLAIMSHELRTPLNGVVGSADLLSETSLDQEQSGLLRLIQSSSRFLLSLVSNVLDFAGMESGKVHLSTRDIDIVDVLEDTAVGFSSAASEKGLALWLDVAPELPRYLHADDARIRQLVGNLIDNAIKFTDRGRVLVTARANGEQEKDVRLFIEVADSGAGIAPAHREMIFERFTQQDTSLSRRNTGVGLGLSISRLLANSMDGDVRVREGHPCGSVFTAEFVVERAHAEHSNAGNEPKVTGELRCAVCCRQSEQRQAVLHALARLGVAVVQRIDGSHPVHAVIAELPDAEVSIDAHVKSLARTYGVASRAVLLLCPRGQALSQGMPLYMPLCLADLVDALPSERELKQSDRVPVSIRPASAERVDFSGAKILVAEDNLVNQKVLLSMLRKLGIQADAVVDGQQAVEAFMKDSWVAVLMDIQMPVMDGLAATEKIRKLEADRGTNPIPVIAVSANAMPADIERGLASGVTAYLTKPLQLSTLQETLAHYLLASVDEEAATRH